MRFASAQARPAALAVVAALLLWGCAVGPDFKQPEAPKSAGYSPAPMPDTTVAADATGGRAQHFQMGRDIPFAWWTLFESPKLNALVDEALRANPNIVSARAALRQAQELADAQLGYFYPTLSADYNLQRQKDAGNVANTSAPGVQSNGQVIAPIQNPTSEPHNSPIYYNLHTAQLSVGFVPDVFGANQRQVESLEAQAAMARFQMEATYISLADNVVAAAIQEASLRAQIKATEQFIAQNAKALEILKNQQKIGYAMRLDVAAQESALAQAKALLPPLRKQFEQTRDLLRALVGKLPDADLEEVFDFESLHLPTELPVTLPSKLVEQRPDVRAAEEQLHSASAQVGVAVAARLPQFTLNANAGYVAAWLSELFKPGSPFWNFGVDSSQLLFDGGTLRHRERAARQALIQAEAQYRSTVITAFQNVADTLHAIQFDADGLAASTEAERAAKVTLEVTQKQYELGYVNYLVLLAAQENYQQAVINLVQAQSTRYGDTAALFQALGGGWWNRPQDETHAAATPATQARAD
jgi:NodT family efflux transporter outer membrane factor (OMF) lipoprotein